MSTNNDNSIIWQAIAEGRIEDAKKALKLKIPQPAPWVVQPQYYPPKDDVEFVFILALEIIQSSPTATLPERRFLINNNGTEAFANLVQLLTSLHVNGSFASRVKELEELTMRVLSSFTGYVREGAGNYPNNPITGLTWFSGFIIREWCNILVEHYSKTGDNVSRANTLLNKAKITCSIMNHYPYKVGPDILACVAALEKIDDVKLAVWYNNAVIADFENIVDGIKSYIDEGVTAEDIISLETLSQAYENKQRFEGTTDYEAAIESLEAIIEAGVTAAPEVEEEE